MTPWILALGLFGALALLSGSGKASGFTFPPLPPEPPEPPEPPPDTPPEPMPIKYGLDEPQIYTPVPSGYRRLKSSEVTAELGSIARQMLSSYASSSYGTLIPFTTSDGGKYAAMVEQHYHEPGGAATPWGYHHGITLLKRV